MQGVVAIRTVDCQSTRHLNFDAAEQGIIEIVKQDLAAGTDVNAKSDKGTIPLHFTVGYSHKEIAGLLILAHKLVNFSVGIFMIPTK